MPIEVVRAVEAKCNAGKRPKMCPSSMSCHACGERVAAIVSAKAKKRRALKGGSGGGRVQSVRVPKSVASTREAALEWAKSHGYKNYTVRETDNFWALRQFEPPEGGDYRTKVLADGVELVLLVGGVMSVYGGYTQDPASHYVSVEEDGGIWLKAMDWDAELASGDGRFLPVDETALMATLGAWVSPAYEMKAHIDHRPERDVAMDFLDAKYEIGDGLYLKVKPQDEEIWKAVAEGAMRPSPEFDWFPDDNESFVDGVVQFVLPSGLGLMWEGKPLSEGSGPDMPSDDALPMSIAGGTMTEKDKNSGAESSASDKGQNRDQDAVAALKAEVEKLQKELGELKTAHEKVLTDSKAVEAEKMAFEKREKEALLKELPDNYPDKDADLKVLRRDAFIYKAAQESARKAAITAPNPKEQDTSIGNQFSEADYEKARQLEAKVRGLNASPKVVFGETVMESSGSTYRPESPLKTVQPGAQNPPATESK